MKHTAGLILTITAGLSCLATGCAEGAANDAAHTDAVRSREVAAARDSILPMDTMIAVFQARLPATAALADDAPTSRDELIQRFASAVEDSSANALAALTLSVAEFAYLYFPTSIYAREPYAQPPAVNWLLMEQNSLKGAARLLRTYGGRSLVVEGHACTGEPKVQGPNRIHEQCTIRMRAADGTIEEVRLFGSIIERDGRYKLMSLANRL